MSNIQDHRSNFLDMEEYDIDYEDMLYMERTCIKEFVCPGQAVALYLLWDRADQAEVAFRAEHFNMEEV